MGKDGSSVCEIDEEMGVKIEPLTELPGENTEGGTSMKQPSFEVPPLHYGSKQKKTQNK